MRPAIPPTSAARADHSRFVQRIRRRYSAELSLLPPGLPDTQIIQQLVQRLLTDGRPLDSALRVARQLVLERLAVLDVECAAPLADITGAMTELAEVTLEIALTAARSEQDLRCGPPLDAQGQVIDFWIVGMGKLGARELNVSSDIDLIYLYEDDGHTRGALKISAHEYFSAVAKRLYALIGDSTDDGFVFRVDLALRPNGNSGSPVVSLAMLEEYFLVQGREWERFAWLKSRVVAPRAAVLSGRALPLRSLVSAFVYRRYLDYGIFEGLRQLHRKIRDEAQRRAAGRPERANDVKLSRGGIREIEFIVQLLLVVRGGQFPEIRSRSTLKSLQHLAARGLMKPDTADKLAEAYGFLRQIEHRIQYLDDQQTHLLPTNDADLAWIAQSLGLALCRPEVPVCPEGALRPPPPDTSWPAWCGPAPACELLDRLCETRELVATEFDALLYDGQAPSNPGAARNGCKQCGAGPLAIDSDDLLDCLPPGLSAKVREWREQPRVRALRDDGRLRLGKLVQRTAACIADATCTEAAALRFIDWLEPLLRRDGYLALLVERPEVMRRLLRLLGLARWPMQYLMRHPGVIDELSDYRQLQDPFDAGEYLLSLDERHRAWVRAGEDHEGALLDTLRHAHHAEVFRTLVRDVEGLISVEQVADDLSALADATLACTLRWAWPRLRQHHRETPNFAVIAYGKLGGQELGYGSDLDVVFLYDDADEADPDSAQEVYGHFVRKLISWLTLRTAAGELFDIDTALRPNGNSGLLVSSINSFERYQIGRGSNIAWAWEHQALTRARFCAGSAALGARFDAVRRQVLAAPRDAAALKLQVIGMRDKVRAARPVRDGLYDVKHSPGGMMDAEFVVQTLVLTEAARHPELLDNAGNIALLQRAERAGLLPPGVGQAAANAYRELRRAQHTARLDERPTQFDPASLAAERAAVLVLWQAVFG
jgi:glutamate-ammonia-ligase adenylyltransferase